jgi:putative ABC transport system substrate-binding protein
MRVRVQDRRQFLSGSLALAGLGVLAGCGMLPTGTTPPKKPRRIGVFHVGIDHVPPSLEGMRDGLQALGYEEGRDVEIDWRNLVDEAAAVTTAQELVRSRVDLIVAFENQTARAAKDATTEIPIVFIHVTDPVANGLVKSLARPDGNLTGIGGWPDLSGKKMELFKEIHPGLRRLLILTDPRDPIARRTLTEARDAAVDLKLDLVEHWIATESDLEQAFGSLAVGEVDGVFVASTNLQTNFGTQVIRLASEKAIPVASNRREWVEQGALWSYGPNVFETGKVAAIRYVDKILKGVKPSDLPVEENDVLELAINLQVARTLGLTIPQAVLSQTSVVIE